jgi:hypothetical protein
MQHNGVAAAVSLRAKEGLSSSFRINAARAQRNGRCGKIYAAVKKICCCRKRKRKKKENETERTENEGLSCYITHKYGEFF